MDASLKSLDSYKSDRGQLLKRIKELKKIEDVLEEDKESVPIPIGMVELMETKKSAGPITRSRVRELAQANIVPLEVELEIKSQEPQGESKEEVRSAEATSSLQLGKGSPRVAPEEGQLSVIIEEAISNVKWRCIREC